MSEYSVHKVAKADIKSLSTGSYIVVLQPAKIPPHLLLLVNSKIFSLSLTGPKLDVAWEYQLRAIQTRKLETFFFKLKIDLEVHGDQLYSKACKNTLLFSRVEPGIATCLSPIKHFCEDLFGININDVNYIFDLLPLLEKQELIEACYQLNAETILINNTFTFKQYTFSDIFENARTIAN